MTYVIKKPFDAHLHLRSGEMAELVTPMSAKQFSDVLVMPNLQPPIKTVQQAIGYRNELIGYNGFCNYHMALYLTETTDIREITKASLNPHIIGFKLYPLNATTGSDDGISDIKKVYHLLEQMERDNVPLLVHGEVTRPEIDIFDRESIFILEVLAEITDRFPKLRITLEHITTSDAVDFVIESDNVVATITAHHLLINRNAIFTVGKNTALNPHAFCLPIAKAEKHRLALVKAAISGNKKFFCGTDSAPHLQNAKESSCGCAGCYTGLHGVELYATTFENEKSLYRLDNFLSIFGRNHYGIKIPDEFIRLERENFIIPSFLGRTENEDDEIEINDRLIPFWAGETLNWKVYQE